MESAVGPSTAAKTESPTLASADSDVGNNDDPHPSTSFSSKTTDKPEMPPTGGSSETPTPPGGEKPEEETRVITLDTIIRKGLVEQMPMTAKDVVNIVSKSMQKERERQAADRARLAQQQRQQQAQQVSSKLSNTAATATTTATAFAAGSSRIAGTLEDDSTDEGDSNEDDDDDIDDHDDDGDDADDDGIQSAVAIVESPIKQPTISVIQRAPPQQSSIVCNQMQLADDLRASSGTQSQSEDQLEDFELGSGDLHYSESNPSDYSDVEHQQQNRAQPTTIVGVDTDPIAAAGRANVRPRSVRRKRNTLIPVSVSQPTHAKLVASSCTDSKRNAILMQCSAAAGMVQQHQHQHSTQSKKVEKNDIDHSEEYASTIASATEITSIKLERLTPVDNVNMSTDNIVSPTPALVSPEVNTKTKPKSCSVARGGLKANARTKKNCVPDANNSALDANNSASSSSAKRRDKRQAAVKVTSVYAELSDEPQSEQPIVAVASTAYKKPRTAKVAKRTLVASAAESVATTEVLPPQRIHWKTQLKLQRQLQYENEVKMHSPATSATVETTTETTLSTTVAAEPVDADAAAADADAVDGTTTSTPPSYTDCGDDVASSAPGSPASSSATAGSISASASGSTVADAIAAGINKIIEPPHNQKRIPKLKYGSFNFTERRSCLAKGPKMVLKYKKKYKRKAAKGVAILPATATQAEREAAAAASDGDETMAEAAESKTNRNPVLPNGNAPNIVQPLARTQLVKKRKASVKTGTMTNLTSTTNTAEPPHKQSKSTNATMKLLNPAANTDESAPAFVDTTRSLRERNKVLLELLEHRIYEIRHLKLRLANMQQNSNAALHATPNQHTNSSNNKNNGFGGSIAVAGLAVASVASKHTATVKRPKIEPGSGGGGVGNTLYEQHLNSLGPIAATDATPDWSADELAQAHCLQTLSPLLYAHLQQCYSLPLPLSTECQAWRAALRIDCGRLLVDQLRQLQAGAAHLSSLQRIAVLQMSALPLRAAYEYAERTDRLTHTTAPRLHVVWARGLHSDWQQPLFVSTVGLAELVPAIGMIIGRLHGIGYNVIACCARWLGDTTTSSDADVDRVDNASDRPPSDYCGAQLWQQLGVSRGYSYFSHPVTNEPVYTFYFGGDLLRSVQRQLLRRTGAGGGFRTVDTPPMRITRQPLDELGKRASGWLAAACSYDAAQLFGERTTELLRAVQPTQYAALADFVDVFGAWSRLMHGGEYGGDGLESQMQTLSHVQLQLHKLRVGGDGDADSGGGVPEFKAPITHSIESLKLLQHTMRQKYGVDAFPARSVCEDSLRLQWRCARGGHGAADGTDIGAASLRDTLERLCTMAGNEVRPSDAHLARMRNGAAAKTAVSTTTNVGGRWSRIDVDRPERHYVQQLIDGMVQPYAALAERQKFIADLWRMEERFQTLWTPFYVQSNSSVGVAYVGGGSSTHDVDGGGARGVGSGGCEPTAMPTMAVDHVLRDTLGKLKPAASLECAVRFMQQRIALRVAVVNALGGVERWPSFVLGTATAAASARRSLD